MTTATTTTTTATKTNSLVPNHLSGSWNIKFGSGAPFKFEVTGGKVVINGKPVQLLPSDKVQFPARDGWLRFVFMRWIYYLSFNGKMQLYRYTLISRYEKSQTYDLLKLGKFRG